MALPALLAAIPALMPVLDRILSATIPDPQERQRAVAAAQTELLNAAQAQDAAQAEINRAEAESPNLFIAGWRPFIGWVCGWAIAWAFVVGPIVKWLVLAGGGNAAELPPTVIDANLWELVIAMLGLGTLRTIEKKWRVQS